jgi:hypothetical protein
MPAILISKNDGTEEWARSMARIQYAIWVDAKAKCVWCGKPYASVDEFITRNPRVGLGFREGDSIMEHFVDEVCWPEHKARNEASASGGRDG